MSKSKLIRALLGLFPALKPREIERLLAERGVAVDVNQIVQARLRYRRDRHAHPALCRVLAPLLNKRPDLLNAVQASFDDMAQKIEEAAAANPGLTETELAEVLAATLLAAPPKETAATRLSRAFRDAYERYPHYRRAAALALGCRPEQIRGIAVQARDFPDDLTDEQMEAVALAWLDRHLPSGPIAEAVARAYLDGVKRRVEAEHAERRQEERAEGDRAVAIMASVLDRLRAPAADPDAALAVVRQFMAEYPDWSDEEIAERIVVGLDHAARLEHQTRRAGHGMMEFDGLTIRART